MLYKWFVQWWGGVRRAGERRGEVKRGGLRRGKLKLKEKRGCLRQQRKSREIKHTGSVVI